VDIHCGIILRIFSSVGNRPIKVNTSGSPPTKGREEKKMHAVPNKQIGILSIDEAQAQVEKATRKLEGIKSALRKQGTIATNRRIRAELALAKAQIALNALQPTVATDSELTAANSDLEATNEDLQRQLGVACTALGSETKTKVALEKELDFARTRIVEMQADLATANTRVADLEIEVSQITKANQEQAVNLKNRIDLNALLVEQHDLDVGNLEVATAKIAALTVEIAGIREAHANVSAVAGNLIDEKMALEAQLAGTKTTALEHDEFMRSELASAEAAKQVAEETMARQAAKLATAEANLEAARNEAAAERELKEGIKGRMELLRDELHEAHERIAKLEPKEPASPNDSLKITDKAAQAALLAVATRAATETPTSGDGSGRFVANVRDIGKDFREGATPLT